MRAKRRLRELKTKLPKIKAGQTEDTAAKNMQKDVPEYYL
jgi:hypothetical protein